jgi:hypothetical protein
LIEFNIPFGIPGYSRKQITNVTRIETNELKICQPTLVRSQKHLIQEQAFIVHVFKKGKPRITPIVEKHDN